MHRRRRVFTSAMTYVTQIVLVVGLVAGSLLGLVQDDDDSLAYAQTTGSAATAQSVISTTNAIATLTIPAPPVGKLLYLVSVQVTRSCTTAITGTALLEVTTTNFGTLGWLMGNACAVGTTNSDVEFFPSRPVKSVTPGAVATIVCPAIGTAGFCRITATYLSEGP